jgi:hypothetical protein
MLQMLLRCGGQCRFNGRQRVATGRGLRELLCRCACNSHEAACRFELAVFEFHFAEFHLKGFTQSPAQGATNGRPDTRYRDQRAERRRRKATPSSPPP